jgi:mono/diheme cytochrome c family protein
MKFFALSSLAGAGLLLFAVFSPQTVIDKQALVLKNAKSLQVTYNVRISGAKTDYTLVYSKPNMLLVESPDRLIETDGKTFWEYNKTTKTYSETPVTPEMFAKKAQSDEILAWASFFTEDFVKAMANLGGGTSRVLKGQQVTEVTFTLGTSSPRQVTMYVDDKLGIARGFAMKTPGGDLLAMADKIEIGAEPLAVEKFAFTAPSGATKQVAPKPEEMAASFASIQPILQANCVGCHGSGRAKGGYSVSNYQSTMMGGYIVPGNPDSSSFVKYLTGDLQPRMPQGRGPLSHDDIEKIKAWIKAGAKE